MKVDTIICSYSCMASPNEGGVGSPGGCCDGFPSPSHFLCRRRHFNFSILTAWMKSSSESNWPLDSIESVYGSKKC